MTRCVDPTQAMKATFSSASIGSCHSSRPEKVSNKYIFSNRCDYMGPVSTVITVQSDEAYTEVNQLTVDKLPRTDLVIAKRIGDCREDPRSKSAERSLGHSGRFAPPNLVKPKSRHLSRRLGLNKQRHRRDSFGKTS